MVNGFGTAANIITGMVTGFRLAPVILGLPVIGYPEETVGIGKEVTGDNYNHLLAQ
jgi:hypothetical protein